MLSEEQPFPEKRLRGVFEELGSGCSKFVSVVRGANAGSGAGKTKLDKERQKLLLREMVGNNLFICCHHGMSIELCSDLCCFCVTAL
jgi:hypothetical protein